MNTAPAVDIVLGVYNKPHLAAGCLQSLIYCTDSPQWKLILIDDCSDAVTHQLLSKYAAEHPNVRLFRNSKHLGLVGTYSRGISLSDAEYVVLLHSDALLSPGWLHKLLAAAQSDDSIAAVNPLSNHAAQFSVPMAPGASFLTMNDLLLRQRDRRPVPIATAIGYCLLIRRKALRLRRDSDEIYGQGYCEQTDLHVWLTAGGWRAVAAPDTYVYHLAHGTSGKALAPQRSASSTAVFGRRWGAPLGRNSQSFAAADPLDRIRSCFEADALQKTSAPQGKPLLSRAAGLLVRNGGKLLPLALRPRRALAALRRRLAARPAVAGQSEPAPTIAAESPFTRFYYEKHTRREAPSVVFVLEGLGPFGGCQRIVELANRLILQGVEARLAVASRATVAWELLRNACFAPMFFEDYEDLLRNCPHCHVAVATFWPTVPCVAELVTAGVAKVGVNFLQDFDPWFYADQQLRQKASSMYPLLEHRVATSNWLKEMLLQHGSDSTVIPLGFDALQFYPAPKPKHSPERIIAMARPDTPYRGFDDLVAALRHVRAQQPGVEIALFGCCRLRDYRQLDFPVIDLGVVWDREELRRQYNQADVFVDASHFQGFGLPALEAMACGLGCVLTNVGGVNQYARHELNALMVPPRDPEACGDAVLRLLRDTDLRRQLGIEARKTVESMQPAEEAKAWIDYLGRLCPSFGSSAPVPAVDCGMHVQRPGHSHCRAEMFSSSG